jgi:Homing endonuclease associated repeat
MGPIGAKTMTKQEVIASILECTEKLGHVPSRVELIKHSGVGRQQIVNHFGSYERALRACNLEQKPRKKAEMDVLFRDWAGVVRALGKVPTHLEYEEKSKYSIQPLRGRFGGWLHVPAGMKQYAEEQGITVEWADVIELIERWNPRQRIGPRVSMPPALPKILVDRPMYGPLIGSGPLVCGPTNEQGVIFLFGALAEQLGFLVLRMQTGFPDCEAWRVVGKDRLQRVRIEIEHESRNFLRHGHDPNGCDLIVCWEHNWEECPLEVVELRKVVERSGDCASSGDRVIGKNQNLTTDEHGISADQKTKSSPRRHRGTEKPKPSKHRGTEEAEGGKNGTSGDRETRNLTTDAHRCHRSEGIAKIARRLEHPARVDAQLA